MCVWHIQCCGGSPRVVCLDVAARQLVALPVAGFFDFEDCVPHLLGSPSDLLSSGAPSHEAALFHTWLPASTHDALSGDALKALMEPDLRSHLQCVSGVAVALVAHTQAACRARGVRLDTMLPLEVRRAFVLRVGLGRSLFLLEGGGG